jgi:DNA-binding CsgD family transcriptional regulator
VDKEKLIKLVSLKLSIREIAKEFGVSPSTVRYYLKKFELKTIGYKKTVNWTKQLLVIAVKNSHSKSEVLRKLGLKIRSGNFQTLEKYASLYEINLSELKFDFGISSTKNGFQKRLTLDDIFSFPSKTNNTKTVKKRALEEGFLENKCYECQQEPNWNGKPLVLQLDHINGDRADNRVSNLRILCPNCHSQTDTFCSKQARK